MSSVVERSCHAGASLLPLANLDRREREGVVKINKEYRTGCYCRLDVFGFS